LTRRGRNWKEGKQEYEQQQWLECLTSRISPERMIMIWWWSSKLMNSEMMRWSTGLPLPYLYSCREAINAMHACYSCRLFVYAGFLCMHAHISCMHACMHTSRACMFPLYEMLMNCFYNIWMHLVLLMRH
jgi:hypothetical protein